MAHFTASLTSCWSVCNRAAAKSGERYNAKEKEYIKGKENLDLTGSDDLTKGRRIAKIAEDYLKGIPLFGCNAEEEAMARRYADRVKEVYRKMQDADIISALNIEKTLKFDEATIRPDALLWSPQKSLLIIYDLKTTAGEHYDRTAFQQLFFYAYLTQRWLKAKDVYVVLYQPYLKTAPETWKKFHPEEYEAWFKTRVADIEKYPDHARAGEHCTHCPFFHKCGACRKWAFSVPESDEMTDAEKIAFFQKMDMQKRLAEHNREEIKEQMMQGGLHVPGYKIVEGRKTRAVPYEQGAEILRCHGLNIENVTEKKILIGRVDAVLGKEKTNAIFADVMTYKETPPQLVKESDIRPEIHI